LRQFPYLFERRRAPIREVQILHGTSLRYAGVIVLTIPELAVQGLAGDVSHSVEGIHHVESLAIDMTGRTEAGTVDFGPNSVPEGRQRLDPPSTNLETRYPMVTVGLLATLNAKPGKEQELSEFLASALPLAENEPDTTAWFAIKLDDSTYGIFDVFPADDGRQAHLNGPIAAALMDKADDLLASPPDIKPLDVLAAKLPS